MTKYRTYLDLNADLKLEIGDLKTQINDLEKEVAVLKKEKEELKMQLYLLGIRHFDEIQMYRPKNTSRIHTHSSLFKYE